jgi:DNA ligase (NAD+)
MEPLPAGWQDWDAARLAAAIREHNARYWDENAPTISDYDFDRLVEALRALDPEAPVLTALGPSPGALGDPVEHVRPMLSLDKAYDEASLHKWAAKFEGDLVMTPKVDGLACSIRYEGGRLAVAATRGSGEVGEDVTINVRLMDDVPASIPTADPVEVRGEIYLPLSAFHALQGDFANPRNTAAGALKHKDAARFRAMGLRFFAYDVLGVDIDTEMHKFDLATAWGFAAVEHQLVTRENVQAGYEAYVAKRESLDFEIDGVVFKANRLDEQARLGATSHHPRYAIAYKLQGESATTWLRDVEWSVSRNGVLTPVGIVEPVKLSGATVTRISLHNWGLVQAKELSLNAQVVAMRRGGVIPYLEAVVEPGDTPIVPPEHCPSCGAAAEVEGDLVWCRNPAGCRAQTIAVLSHYAKTVDIEGFGQVWLEKLLDAGLLRWPPDFYRLKPIDLLEFERMGEVLAGKMIEAVDARRVVALPTFLQALGVKDLGKTAARTLAERYGTLEAVRAATPDELVELPKFAALLANRVVEGLAERAELIDALLEHVEVTPVEIVNTPAGGPLEGQSFLFTATLAAMKRADAEDKVRALGGTVASGVSRSLGFLVVGSEGKAGSKLQKAEKAGVTILDEATFLERLAAAEAEIEVE